MKEMKCVQVKKNGNAQMWEMNHGIDRRGGKNTKKPHLSLTISKPVLTFQNSKLKNIICLPADLSVPLYIHIPSIQISSI